jgi:hypothetical protein
MDKVNSLLRQEWEDDAAATSFGNTDNDVQENDLDLEENQEDLQREALIASLKNRRKNPMNPTLFEDAILKEYIESEILEEEFEGVPLEEVVSSVIGGKGVKVVKQFEFFDENQALSSLTHSFSGKLEKVKSTVEQLLTFKKETNNLLESTNAFTCLIALQLPCFHTVDVQVPLIKSLYNSKEGIDIFYVVKNETQVEEYKKVLEEDESVKRLLGVHGVFEVVHFDYFRKLYGSYSQKIQLSQAYDLFFYDESVDEDSVLGHFGSRFKKKHPVKVESVGVLLKTLKHSIQSTQVHMEKGQVTVEVVVGKSTMSVEDIVKNIHALCSTVKLPSPVNRIYLKTSVSPSVPVYVAPLVVKTLKQFKKEKSFVNKDRVSFKKKEEEEPKKKEEKSEEKSKKKSKKEEPKKEEEKPVEKKHEPVVEKKSKKLKKQEVVVEKKQEEKPVEKKSKKQEVVIEKSESKKRKLPASEEGSKLKKKK